MQLIPYRASPADVINWASILFEEARLARSCRRPRRCLGARCVGRSHSCWHHLALARCQLDGGCSRIRPRAATRRGARGPAVSRTERRDCSRKRLDGAAAGGCGLVRLCPAVAFWSFGKPRTPLHTGGYGNRANGARDADRGGNSTAGGGGPM